ncbi:hypothetical protein [Asticcacaulis sp. W401b]|uniref:hypothetical protein n=1 Tax=Asticcacaulis sp. W401b TaxID=3388666 RepID=UPI0039708EDD
MSLEKFIADLNGSAFWKEFTFAQNKFKPGPSEELELADSIVWLEAFALIIQLKERTAPTGDPEAERAWFSNKVLKKAKKQVRDTHHYLSTHSEIAIVNERGERFVIRGKQLQDIQSIIVYSAYDALPDDCWAIQYTESAQAGFIHILDSGAYLDILRILRVPGDIREYFSYRKTVVPQLKATGVRVQEADIIGAYTHDEVIPTPTSHKHLHNLIQDLDSFELTGLIGNIRNNIETSTNPTDYYRIMIEFGKLPRSVWHALKGLLQYAVETVRAEDFALPVRAYYGKTDCVFMIMPLAPELWGADGEAKVRRGNGLQGFTQLAKYIHKARRGIGIQISRDGSDYLIDWALIDEPWEPEAEIEARLLKFNPFRDLKEKEVKSFHFREV